MILAGDTLYGFFPHIDEKILKLFLMVVVVPMTFFKVPIYILTTYSGYLLDILSLILFPLRQPSLPHLIHFFI
mgnify:CR=1 FL=1